MRDILAGPPSTRERTENARPEHKVTTGMRFHQLSMPVGCHLMAGRLVFLSSFPLSSSLMVKMKVNKEKKERKRRPACVSFLCPSSLGWPRLFINMPAMKMKEKKHRPSCRLFSLH